MNSDRCTMLISKNIANDYKYRHLTIISINKVLQHESPCYLYNPGAAAGEHTNTVTQFTHNTTHSPNQQYQSRLQQQSGHSLSAPTGLLADCWATSPPLTGCTSQSRPTDLVSPSCRPWGAMDLLCLQLLNHLTILFLIPQFLSTSGPSCSCRWADRVSFNASCFTVLTVHLNAPVASPTRF